MLGQEEQQVFLRLRRELVAFGGALRLGAFDGAPIGPSRSSKVSGASSAIEVLSFLLARRFPLRGGLRALELEVRVDMLLDRQHRVQEALDRRRVPCSNSYWRMRSALTLTVSIMSAACA